jgi:dTDP-4-amino-4,6-dideoxygalactose transaminase
MIKFCKADIGYEEEIAVRQVLHSGWLAAGEKTKQFEKEFADFVGVKYAIFTNSGTSALKMAYKYLLEEMKEDIVVGPRNTFSATYSAAEEVGVNYEFEDNPQINVDDVRAKVVVHYGGIKNETSCYLEDSAHRIEPNDSLVGKIRIYSFYVTKNMTTGAGGMLVTNDKKIYEKCRLYWQDGINKSTYDRQHGGWDYKVEEMAGGYDGNDLAAAIGLVQLKRLPGFIKERNTIRDIYNKEFKQDWQGNHLYPYFVKSEEDVYKLLNQLKAADIQGSYHYPNTGWLGVSLPIYPDLKPSEQEKIVEEVKLWALK